MVNFMCQLDYGIRVPKQLVTFYPGCFSRGALDEFTIEISRLSKADCPSWVGINPLKV